MDIEVDFQSRFFASTRGRIHYEFHRGSGPSIIFIHGFAGSTKSWSRLVKYMPTDLNIYLIDLLGHGLSDAPDVDYSLIMHYEILTELLDGENLKEYYLFGHSYGGWLAAYSAIEHQIAGLILEDSAGLKEFMAERRENNPNYIDELVHKAIQINPREMVLRRVLDADNEEAYLTASNLGRIKSRTLIIWGGNDTTVKRDYSKVFNKAIPGSRIVVLENERHTPHYSNPEAVAKLILDFVRD